MTCFTDQPGMQLYVANQPIEVTGKNGTQYACHTSVCLETQHFPDAINHDNFPSIVLTPDVGQVQDPQYFSATQETSTVGDGILDALVFVQDGELTADYYTVCYLKVGEFFLGHAVSKN